MTSFALLLLPGSSISRKHLNNHQGGKRPWSSVSFRRNEELPGISLLHTSDPGTYIESKENQRVGEPSCFSISTTVHWSKRCYCLNLKCPPNPIRSRLHIEPMGPLGGFTLFRKWNLLGGHVYLQHVVEGNSGTLVLPLVLLAFQLPWDEASSSMILAITYCLIRAPKAMDNAESMSQNESFLFVSSGSLWH